MGERLTLPGMTKSPVFPVVRRAWVRCLHGTEFGYVFGKYLQTICFDQEIILEFRRQKAHGRLFDDKIFWINISCGKGWN